MNSTSHLTPSASKWLVGSSRRSRFASRRPFVVPEGCFLKRCFPPISTPLLMIISSRKIHGFVGYPHFRKHLQFAPDHKAWSITKHHHHYPSCLVVRGNLAFRATAQANAKRLGFSTKIHRSVGLKLRRSRRKFSPVELSSICHPPLNSSTAFPICSSFAQHLEATFSEIVHLFTCMCWLDLCVFVPMVWQVSNIQTKPVALLEGVLLKPFCSLAAFSKLFEAIWMLEKYIS